MNAPNIATGVGHQTDDLAAELTDTDGGHRDDAATIATESAVGTGDGGVQDCDFESGEDCDVLDGDDATPSWRSRSPVKLATLMGLMVVVVLATLMGWLGFRAYESHQAKERSALFLQAARQSAVNLTTIDYAEADTDVQRILDSATGTFYDDFSKRSQPFVDVVKKTQSKSVGTVTEAGSESETNDDAQVLVTVMVKSSNAGAGEQQPRAWRMRMLVHEVGDQVKVSNVEFVP
jgi:Mce-associated membrane protein